MGGALASESLNCVFLTLGKLQQMTWTDTLSRIRRGFVEGGGEGGPGRSPI